MTDKIRGLLPPLFDACKSGMLAPLIQRIRADHTLSLEIRSNYFNVYYRGGSLLRVSPRKSHEFRFKFDPKYFTTGKTPTDIPDPRVHGNDQVAKWVAMIPRLKEEMDFFFVLHRRDEREVQQQIVRDNNFGGASGSDYFICDIEYAFQAPKPATGVEGENSRRFDLVAVGGLRSGVGRLALIELKYGDGAIDGDAGLLKHFGDLDRHLKNDGLKRKLQGEMLTIFRQKRELDLIKTKVELKELEPRVELLLFFVNHDSRRGELRDRLAKLPQLDHVDVRIVSGALPGYGLYEKTMMSPKDFSELQRGRF